MGFQWVGSRLVSDVTKTEYQVGEPFERVLQTLPDDSVPRGLVWLGILTEHLEPVDEDIEDHLRVVTENVADAPTATISPQTVCGIERILSRERTLLDTVRNQVIDDLITSASLDSPGVIEASAEPDPTGTANRAQRDDREQSNADRKTDVAETEAFDREFCTDSFGSESALKSRSIDCETRPAEARHECEHCQNVYISQQYLKQHLEDCSSTSSRTVYRCDHCDKEFEDALTMIRHEHACADVKSHADTRTVQVASGATGVVVEYDASRGFGFITTFDISDSEETRADGAVKVFFHVSEYPGDQASEGDRLGFDVERTERGLRAVNILRAQSGTSATWSIDLASERPRWGQDSYFVTTSYLGVSWMRRQAALARRSRASTSPRVPPSRFAATTRPTAIGTTPSHSTQTAPSSLPAKPNARTTTSLRPFPRTAINWRLPTPRKRSGSSRTARAPTTCYTR